MRIRKQAKLAGVPISNGISSGDQIKLRCQLNQSPWDVISSPQIREDHGFTPGGTSGNSLGAFESVDSMKADDPSGCVDFFSSNGDVDDGDDALLCAMTDGKTWKCMHEVVEGQAVCLYHLDHGQKKPVATVSVATGHRPKKKRAAPKAATPPEEVYYFYGEFCPWLRTKRGDKGKDRTKPIPTEVDGKKTYDYVNDYDSDGDGIGETGKTKKARKPIKARSLKSLM